MDQSTRAMVLPGKSGIDVPGIPGENVPPAPRSLPPIRAERFEELRREGKALLADLLTGRLELKK